MAIKRWTIDTTHSNIVFSVRHMLVSKVRGRFVRWSGELDFAEAVPSAGSARVRIEAACIDTHVPERDAHLRSIDFLDASRHPIITFESTTIDALGARQFRVYGDLTIRGVTREVALDVEYSGRIRDPSGCERVGFTARASISRKAFGITFNHVLASGGLAVGDRVDIAIDVEAVEAIAVENRVA